MATAFTAKLSFPVKEFIYPPVIVEDPLSRRPLRRKFSHQAAYEYELLYEYLNSDEKAELESLKDSLIIVTPLGSNFTCWILDDELKFTRQGPDRFSITIRVRGALDTGV